MLGTAFHMGENLSETAVGIYNLEVYIFLRYLLFTNVIDLVSFVVFANLLLQNQLHYIIKYYFSLYLAEYSSSREIKFLNKVPGLDDAFLSGYATYDE
jgi:hypothetical protein